MPLKHSSEWDAFTRRIYVHRPLEDVYRAWATSAGLASWFLEKAKYFAPDGAVKAPEALAAKEDRYEWKWWGHAHDGLGVVLAANGRGQFSFLFEEHTTVAIKLQERKGRTLVELRQRHRHPKESERKSTWLHCHAPWSYHLANLKSILEGGVDLREKKPDVKDLVNS